MRSGYVLLNYGYLRSTGYEGDDWAATAYPSANYAYRLGFYPTGIDPSNYYSRYHGFSLRCLQE